MLNSSKRIGHVSWLYACRMTSLAKAACRRSRLILTLLLSFISLGFALFLASASTSAGRTFSVFGPANYIRSRGKPEPFTSIFTVLTPKAQYTLQIFNGGANGQFKRVENDPLKLNGVLVVSPREFDRAEDHRIRLIEKPVVLAAQNSLTVELRGEPGSGLTLQVLGLDNDYVSGGPSMAAASYSSFQLRGEKGNDWLAI